MPLNHLQMELVRSIVSAGDEGFRTDRLTLNYRRALNALFEQGLITPHGASGFKVILAPNGRRMIDDFSSAQTDGAGVADNGRARLHPAERR